MSDLAVNVNNISKSFKIGKGESVIQKVQNRVNQQTNKRFLALGDISFKVPKGEILAIIGMNGSGKTTLLRTIAGIYKPDSGSVIVNGKISHMLQIGTGFHSELAAKDNITMYGLLLGLTKSEIEKKVDGIIEYAELEKFSRMKLKHYSSGMKMRLAFSTALDVNPDIILMDEAMAVGDKHFQEKSYNSFHSFKQEGKTILYSTHSLGKIKDFADNVLLLNQGKKIMIGKPSEVLQKYNELIKKKKDNAKNL